MIRLVQERDAGGYISPMYRSSCGLLNFFERLRVLRGGLPMPETGPLTHAPERADGMHHHRPVILVVDVERGIHEFCHALLGDQYDLLGAHDGPAALATLDSHHVDLVLLDLRLPGVYGLEILAQINDTRPQLKVIILTAVM